ncbi:hypothetical protein, partial [Streptomyces sp. NPDC058656]|uniref:hypothetical protein n=1 Tax=Streptomyces sp. NPDC058656 TaxID=3346578 RepID=UPI003658C411
SYVLLHGLRHQPAGGKRQQLGVGGGDRQPPHCAATVPRPTRTGTASGAAVSPDDRVARTPLAEGEIPGFGDAPT